MQTHMVEIGGGGEERGGRNVHDLWREKKMMFRINISSGDLTFKIKMRIFFTWSCKSFRILYLDAAVQCKDTLRGWN